MKAPKVTPEDQEAHDHARREYARWQGRIARRNGLASTPNRFHSAQEQAAYEAGWLEAQTP